MCKYDSYAHYLPTLLHYYSYKSEQCLTSPINCINL